MITYYYSRVHYVYLCYVLRKCRQLAILKKRRKILVCSALLYSTLMVLQ